MKTNKTIAILLSIGIVASFSLSAQARGADRSEAAAPIARGVSGDIPDSQAFIKYSPSPAVYSILVPEGWARTGQGNNVRFIDKLNGLGLQIRNFAGPLSIDAATSAIIPGIVKAGRAVTVKNVATLARKGGEAIVVTFESNSDPNSVTNKQIRLEDKAYLFSDKGRLAILTVWTPYGSDNADQWNLMSDSFRWR